MTILIIDDVKYAMRLEGRMALLRERLLISRVETGPKDLSFKAAHQ